MDFETPNKPAVPEKEKCSSTKSPELTQSPEAQVKIECPERQEVVDQAIFELKAALQTLGIENLSLPPSELATNGYWLALSGFNEYLRR